MRDRARGDTDSIEKLRKINAALMRRVERSMDNSGNAYSLFQTAIALEKEVAARTRDLEATLKELAKANYGLQAAKEEAERARADLSNAIDALQEGFALFDADDRLVMCNAWFRNLAPTIAGRIVPGMSFADYARLVSEGNVLKLRPGEQPEHWFGSRMRRHGVGHETFVQPMRNGRWVQISERATPDGGSVIVHTDVTDMVRQERRERDKMLDEQADLIQNTLDHLSQGVCAFDGRRALVAWNDRYRQLLGLPFTLLKRGASFGRIVNYIAHHTLITSREEAQRVVRWVHAGPNRNPLSVELRRSDGRTLDVHCRMTERGGFVMSFTDVTAEREVADQLYRANETLEQRVLERTGALSSLNDQLRREIGERAAVEGALRDARDAAEEANRAKTRFLAAASHDLLQPLNAARLFLGSLAEAAMPPEQERMVRRVENAFASVEGLLSALLDISRLDSGGVEIVRRPVAVSSVLEPIESEFRPMAEAAGLRFRVAPTTLVVNSDPEHLRRIVQNLVSNAIRYTARGTVLVGCRRRGSGVSIEVLDTGIGFDEDEAAVIFEEFRRLDGSASPNRDARGMGLGLAIVQRACRLLDHPVRVRSAPGRGSIFAVTVPRVTDYVPPAVVSESPSEVETPDGVIALVIENEPDILDATLALLDRWGVDALPAASGQEAGRLVAELGMAPDIVIADFRLDNGETGIAAVTHLRRVYDMAAPVIIVTADRGEATAQAVAAAGAHLLTKPVEPAKLRALIFWLLRQRRRA